MRFLILLVALLFVASPAAAEWSSSPVTNLTVCSAANSQFQDYVISDGVGGAYVAWVDPRSGGIYHLYAQHYDGRGNALWAANGLSIGSLTTFQGELVACGDGVGGLILAWRDDRNAGVTGTDIYVQRLNSSGAALWTANGLAVCTAANTQQFPKIVSDGAGGVFVAWSDWRDSATSNSDVYAQHVLSGGTMAWTANGVVACNATASQLPASLAPDGYGGVVVSWTDSRNFATTGTDLYAQRITSTGAPQWTLNGLVICNAAGDVTPGPMVADGTGTVWMAWTDTRAAGGGSNWDIYAQAVNSSGSIQWGANGYAVCTQTSQQRSPQIWLDGSGSVYLAWTDTRPVTAAELYGQRMPLGGIPQWAADGQSLVAADRARDVVFGGPDGAGGFYLVYTDTRNTGSINDVYAQRFTASGASQWASGGVGLLLNAAHCAYVSAAVLADGSLFVVDTEDRYASNVLDLYGQRVDRYGYLGATEPRITSVKDVPGDQGGRVKLSFLGSYIEDEPWYAYSLYYLYRSLPPNAAASSTRSARLASRDPIEAEALGAPYVNTVAGQDYYWELLSSTAVNYVGTYSVYTQTAQDSFAGGNGRTAFMVQARNGTKHWDSLPDSGWSVDNLSPLAPAPLTAQYAAGSARLHWNRNTEADLAGYRLYRGSSPSFVPGPANFVAELADTGHTDAAGAPYVYKLTAVDIHGNESPVAMATPTGTTDVEGGAPPAAFALTLGGVNPMRAHGVLRLAVPRTSRVRVTVFDATGRSIRTLADGELPAGTHTLEWDGADAAGHRAANGLYFARCDAAGTPLVARFVLAR